MILCAAIQGPTSRTKGRAQRRRCGRSGLRRRRLAECGAPMGQSNFEGSSGRSRCRITRGARSSMPSASVTFAVGDMTAPSNREMFETFEFLRPFALGLKRRSGRQRHNKYRFRTRSREANIHQADSPAGRQRKRADPQRCPIIAGERNVFSQHFDRVGYCATRRALVFAKPLIRWHCHHLF